MPKFVNFLVGAAAIAGGVAISVVAPGPWSFAAMGVGSRLLIGAGAIAISRGLAKSQGFRNQRQGVEVQSADTTNVLPFAYGQTRLAGKLVFLDTRSLGSDRPNYAAEMVTAFCLGSRWPQEGETYDGWDDGQIVTIGSIFFDDRRAFDENGKQLLASFTNLLQLGSPSVAILHGKHRGSPANQEADPTMVGISDSADHKWLHESSDWTPFHRLGGIAYIAMTLHFTPNVLTSIPNVTACVRGRRVYSLQHKHWVDSDNPALCIRDLLLERVAWGGAGMKMSEVNDDQFQAAADKCWEVIAEFDAAGLPISRFRYTLNGVIDPEAGVKANLQQMLAACNGVLTWEQGRYGLKIRDPEKAPVDLILDETNMIGSWSMATAEPDERVNLMIARYVDGVKYNATEIKDQILEVQYPEDENPYLTQDSDYEISREIDFPLCTNQMEAKARARDALQHDRADITCAITAKEIAAQLSLLDIVRVTHSVPGWVEKRFYVMEIGLQVDHNVRLLLREVPGGVVTITPPAPLMIPNGTPFEIITVPAIADFRPARVWITLPYNRAGEALLEVIDIPNTDSRVTIPTPYASGNLVLSFWSAVYVPSWGEVWVSDQDNIHIYDATDLHFKITLNGQGGTIYDMQYHAGTDSVFAGGLDILDADKSGVMRISAASRSKTGEVRSTSIDPVFGDVLGQQNNVRNLAYMSQVDQFAVDSLRDWVWYFDPNTMEETTPLGRLDSIGGLIDTGNWINQMTYDPSEERLYLVKSTKGPVLTWTPGFPETTELAVGDLGMFVELAATWQGTAIIVSTGSGSEVFPGTEGTLRGWSVESGFQMDLTFTLPFHGGRNVYIPEVNWAAVLTDWRTADTTQPQVAFYALGPVPSEAGITPALPPVPVDEDAEAEIPVPGPGTGTDPNQPATVPVFALATYCDDRVTGSAPNYAGSLEVGWEATITTPSGSGVAHPHEIVGFKVGANPVTAIPDETFPIPAPVVGQTYRGAIFRVDGPWQANRPNCGGPSDEPNITRDYYLRRHVTGYTPGPVSNKVTLTLVHPGPKDAVVPPPAGGNIGAPTITRAAVACTPAVSGSSGDWSGSVRVTGEITVTPGSGWSGQPLEIAQFAAGANPDTATALRVIRPTGDGSSGAGSFPVYARTFTHVTDANLPRCRTTPVDDTFDFYARHLKDGGLFGPWSAKKTLAFSFPRSDTEAGIVPAPAPTGSAPTLEWLNERYCIYSPTSDATASAWKGTVSSYLQIRVFAGAGFEQYPVQVYFMTPGQHPDTATAPSPPGVRQQITNGLHDRFIGSVVYTNAQPARPACGTGTAYAYDVYARHETPIGTSEWAGPVAVTGNLSAAPA